MPHSSHALRLTVAHAAGSDDPDFARSIRVPEGEVWHVTRYAFEPTTSIPGAVRSCIRGLGENQYLREWLSPGIGVLQHDDVDLWLSPGEEFALELTTINSGDDFKLYINGEVLVQ